MDGNKTMASATSINKRRHSTFVTDPTKGSDILLQSMGNEPRRTSPSESKSIYKLVISEEPRFVSVNLKGERQAIAVTGSANFRQVSNPFYENGDLMSLGTDRYIGRGLGNLSPGKFVALPVPKDDQTFRSSQSSRTYAPQTPLSSRYNSPRAAPSVVLSTCAVVMSESSNEDMPLSYNSRMVYQQQQKHLIPTQKQLQKHVDDQKLAQLQKQQQSKEQLNEQKLAQLQKQQQSKEQLNEQKQHFLQKQQQRQKQLQEQKQQQLLQERKQRQVIQEQKQQLLQQERKQYQLQLLQEYNQEQQQQPDEQSENNTNPCEKPSDDVDISAKKKSSNHFIANRRLRPSFTPRSPRSIESLLSCTSQQSVQNMKLTTTASQTEIAQLNCLISKMPQETAMVLAPSPQLPPPNWRAYQVPCHNCGDNPFAPTLKGILCKEPPRPSKWKEFTNLLPSLLMIFVVYLIFATCFEIKVPLSWRNIWKKLMQQEENPLNFWQAITNYFSN